MLRDDSQEPRPQLFQQNLRRASLTLQGGAGAKVAGELGRPPGKLRRDHHHTSVPSPPALIHSGGAAGRRTAALGEKRGGAAWA
uniref:Uncharacterized protein n=1 Tax=Arundo donax TaxID=35708 RepID=A0A0A9CX55_ARUDO